MRWSENTDTGVVVVKMSTAKAKKYVRTCYCFEVFEFHNCFES